MDRLARQGKEQVSKSEILEDCLLIRLDLNSKSREDRLGTQGKSVEACKEVRSRSFQELLREAIEVLRDKTQRQIQELGALVSSGKSELVEVEKQQQGLQEAMRRGDRSLAEEFFRKLQDSNEKWGPQC